jgi:hypothetical protein
MAEKPHGNKPSWWDRVQRVMLALVAFSDEAAKVAAALRQIFR